MMNDYESPVKIIYGQMQTQFEDDVLKGVQSYRIEVNKEELIKALRYDRGQFDKGYAVGYADGYGDACAEAKRPKWISVEDRLPEPETEVLLLAESKTYSFKGTVTTRHIVTNGMYEDGSKNTEDSKWCWYDHDFKYDEELDAYIIPEGWWEYKHYNGDDEHNHPIDDTVTHWMPLPEPPDMRGTAHDG